MKPMFECRGTSVLGRPKRAVSGASGTSSAAAPPSARQPASHPGTDRGRRAAPSAVGPAPTERLRRLAAAAARLSADDSPVRADAEEEKGDGGGGGGAPPLGGTPPSRWQRLYARRKPRVPPDDDDDDDDHRDDDGRRVSAREEHGEGRSAAARSALPRGGRARRRSASSSADADDEGGGGDWFGSFQRAADDAARAGRDLHLGEEESDSLLGAFEAAMMERPSSPAAAETFGFDGGVDWESKVDEATPPDISGAFERRKERLPREESQSSFDCMGESPDSMVGRLNARCGAIDLPDESRCNFDCDDSMLDRLSARRGAMDLPEVTRSRSVEAECGMENLFPSCDSSLLVPSSNTSNGDRAECKVDWHDDKVKSGHTVAEEALGPRGGEAKSEPSVGDPAKRRTASVIRNRRRRELLRRYFAALSDLAALSVERRRKRADELLRVKSDRRKRIIVRRWWDLVRRKRLSQQQTEKRFRLRRLRCAFSAWWKVAASERDESKVIMEEIDHRTKARTLRQWRRSVRALRAEREAAREAARRAQEARRDATAREFYRGNILTVCFVGWGSAARSGRDRRALKEGRRRRKALVEGLFGRIGEGSAEEKDGNWEATICPSARGKPNPDDHGSKHEQPKKVAGKKRPSETPSRNVARNSASPSRAVHFDKENRAPNASQHGRSHNTTPASNERVPGSRSRSKIGTTAGPSHPTPLPRPPPRKNSGERKGGPTKRPASSTAPSPLAPPAASSPSPSPSSRSSSSSAHADPRSAPAPSSSRLILSEMDRRWEERRRVRQARLADRRRSERRMTGRREEAEAEARRRRAEEEELRAVREERRRRDDEDRARREELERNREARRFAGLHYRYGLTRRAWGAWKVALDEVDLRKRKADIFFRESLGRRYWTSWVEFLHCQRERQREVELKMMEYAVRRTLRPWHSLVVVHIRRDLYDEVCLLRARRTAARVLRRWVHAYLDEADRIRDGEGEADAFRGVWAKRRALREWRGRAEGRRVDREVEERAEEKWREVRGWLEDMAD